jgi:hypothetical protein
MVRSMAEVALRLSSSPANGHARCVRSTTPMQKATPAPRSRKGLVMASKRVQVAARGEPVAPLS